MREYQDRSIKVGFSVGLSIALVFVTRGCSKQSSVDALIDAAYGGDAAKCEQLIKAGVPVDGSVEDGETALDWAIYGHHLDVVRTLIQLGADVNHTDTNGGYKIGFTPLMYTVRPLRGRKIRDPETMAVRNQIAQFLIEHGADVNRAIDDGHTALHFAVQNQNPDLIRMLLSAGANKNARVDKQYTPMDMANFPDYGPNREVIDALEGK